MRENICQHVRILHILTTPKHVLLFARKLQDKDSNTVKSSQDSETSTRSHELLEDNERQIEKPVVTGTSPFDNRYPDGLNTLLQKDTNIDSTSIRQSRDRTERHVDFAKPTNPETDKTKSPPELVTVSVPVPDVSQQPLSMDLGDIRRLLI